MRGVGYGGEVHHDSDLMATVPVALGRGDLGAERREEVLANPGGSGVMHGTMI